MHACACSAKPAEQAASFLHFDSSFLVIILKSNAICKTPILLLSPKYDMAFKITIGFGMDRY